MDELRAHLKAHLSWGTLEGPDRIRFMSLALCGEAGEIANLIKKDWRGDAGDRRSEIIAELADVGNYVFMLAEALGVDLPAAMLKRLIDVEQRPAWKVGHDHNI
jgi:NTP pyrophosphatase (non-canonical NTP hydrolase)